MKITIQNKLHKKIVHINYNKFNMNNKIDINDDINEIICISAPVLVK